MAWWKRQRIRDFLQTEKPLHFFRSPQRGLRHARQTGGGLAIWASRATPALRTEARETGVPLYLVEDGFIRSMGLGSGFLPPCSVILDSQGAYVDPAHPSDLEDRLNRDDVSPQLRQRTDALITTLRDRHVSKYATEPTAEAGLYLPAGRRIILVPGQVAGDLSVIRGGGHITDNLALLQEVRRRNPEAWIIYRPHPDVEAGHRRGALADAIIYRHADSIHRGSGMSQLLGQIDEVHTLTSLTGFEALLRGKTVTTYGAPFYAGWGLTTHLGPALPRRQRRRDITELAAITLILYPLYLNPETGQRCTVEELVACFGKAHLWRTTLSMRIRQKQGQLRRHMAQLMTRYQTAP